MIPSGNTSFRYFSFMMVSHCGNLNIYGDEYDMVSPVANEFMGLLSVKVKQKWIEALKSDRYQQGEG